MMTNPHTQESTGILPWRRVLLAIDDSPLSEELFQRALTVIAPTGDLMIFHCLPNDQWSAQEAMALTHSIYSGVMPNDLTNFNETLWQETLGEIQGWLKSLTKTAIAEGLTATFEYRVGDPGQEICALADRWQADLIVVGRRGRSGLQEWLLGSVSNYVVHHATATVLVVQHPQDLPAPAH